MTILILTSREDITADAVVDELADRDADVVRFDTADFPTGSRLAATLQGGGWVGTITNTGFPGRVIDLGYVRSVWWRRPTEFRTPEEWAADEQAFAAGEARAGLLGVLGAVGIRRQAKPVRWINHPAAESAANYKPTQLAAAVRVGLDVPPTVITSDPEHARVFIAGCGGEVIYKPLSGGVLGADGSRQYLPVTLITADEIDDGIRATAHLLQRRVDKIYDIRLTVIGDRMFPVAIHADSETARLDWRTDYSSLDYEQVELPDTVRLGVRRLMRELDLYYGALDFAVGRDGSWRFLEINPNGQWHWIAVKTGLPLIAAMADALEQKDNDV